MSNQQPSIGRIVQYRDPDINGGKPTAAIITGVNDDGTISLHYFAPGGHGGVPNVPAYGDRDHPRSWSWPQMGGQPRRERKPDLQNGDPAQIGTGGVSSGQAKVTVIEVEGPQGIDGMWKVLLSDGSTAHSSKRLEIGSEYLGEPTSAPRNDQGRPGSTSAADKK